MKISNEQISKIIDDCKSSGYTIKVRDISFVLLSECYEDMTLAYKVVFGSDFEDSEVEEYNASNALSFLRRYINSNYRNNASNGSKSGKINDITFEENKAEIIRLIHLADEKYASGEIEAKEHLKIVSDLRVKLNDKFKVQEEVKDQLVIVNQKYDDVCPYCHHEIASKIMSMEEAMKKYNLVENK